MSSHTEAQWIDWIDQLAEKDYVVIDHFLSSEHYQNLKNFMLRVHEADKFNQAGIGALFFNQRLTSVRSDFTYWIDRNRDTELSFYFNLVDEMISYLNRYCFLSLSGFEFHFAHYPEGSFYKKHVDQFKDRSNRMITLVYYFNDDWQEGNGGELKIYHNDEIIIQPLANRCVLFRTEGMEHEVLLSKSDRYSLTGWLLYQPPGLGYITI